VAKNKALGRGLSALIGDVAVGEGKAGEGRLRELRIADIAVSRRQPRRSFDEGELQELAQSIRHLGVLQPVVVRPAAEGAGKRFEVIAGERRLRAAALAGLDSIPALMRTADEALSLEMALAENVAREDLNGIEEAHAYAALVDEFGLTHERIGELVGRSRVAVTNVLRLLELPDDVQAMVERGEISEGHARTLLGLAGHDERRKLARLIVKEGLTVRQTEAVVRRMVETPAAADQSAARPADPALDDLSDELYGLLEAPVRIRAGKRGGKLEIRFKDRGELERIVALLRSLGG
jgi:ParB family chromosome partitioning protein